MCERTIKDHVVKCCRVCTVQVVITAEMPTAGGFYMSKSVDTIRLHPYIRSHQFIYLTIELIFLVFTVVFVLRTLRDLMVMGASFYTTPRSLMELGLATSSTFLVTMFVWYNIVLYDVSANVETMHYRELFYLDRLLLAANGFVGFFAILRALPLFRYMPVSHHVIVVMNKASAYVVCSVIFGLLVWLLIASSASALFGHEVVELRSLSSSLAVTAYAMSRVHHYETLFVSHPLAAAIFLMVCILLFICVARAMCIVGLFASFRDVSQLPESEEAQLFFAQLAQNFRDAMSCVGINIKKKKHKAAAQIL